MLRILSILLLCIWFQLSHGQNIGINEDGSTPDPSAILDVKADDKGFLVPRITESNKFGISSPATGLLVFQYDTDPGFYYFDGSSWQKLLSSSIHTLTDSDQDTKVALETFPDEDKIRWTLGGSEKMILSSNANGIPSLDFSNAFDNTLLGESAGLNLTPSGFLGVQNVFLGKLAGNTTSTGSFNVFAGNNAGTMNINGDQNSFIGHDAGHSNSTGSSNTFIGQQAGYFMNSSDFNTFVGQQSGYKNTGYSNTFLGQNSGFNSTIADFNVFVGERSGYNNTTGSQNVLIGVEAGLGIGTGSNNVMIGHGAGYSNSGNNNVFIGRNAGANASGSNKLYIDNSSTGNPLILGDFYGNELLVNYKLGINTDTALATLDNRGDAIFNYDQSDYDFKVFGTTKQTITSDASLNRVAIGHGSPASLLHVRSGSAISGSRIGIGDMEYIEDEFSRIRTNSSIDPTAHLTLDLGYSPSQNAWDDVFADDYVTISDERLKTNIQRSAYGLKEILKLKTYTYKLKNDPFKEKKIGLSAQELIDIIPESVKTENHIYNAERPSQLTKEELDHFGVKYNQLIPVLIRSIQEQQLMIDALNKKIEQLEKN